MKRWVARSTAGDGMTHWYVYFDGASWVPDITHARLYRVKSDGECEARVARFVRAGPHQCAFTMIEVELTIKELV